MGACCGMDKRLTMYEVNAGETGGAAEQATDDNPVLESKNKTADGGLGKPNFNAKSIYASIEDGDESKQESKKDEESVPFREMQKKINAIDTGAAATKAYGFNQEAAGSERSRGRPSHSQDFASPKKNTNQRATVPAATAGSGGMRYPSHKSNNSGSRTSLHDGLPSPLASQAQPT